MLYHGPIIIFLLSIKNTFSPLEFVFNLSQSNRDAFLIKVGWLAMATEIRRTMVEKNLFADINKFKEYLENEDNNPNIRLLKICQTIRAKSCLVKEGVKTIAQECGVMFHKLVSKGEVATFVNYITSFTGKPQNYTAKKIGDAPKGIEAFRQASNNIVIANLNLNLGEKAEVLFELDKFLKRASDIDIIFVNPQNREWEFINLVRFITKNETIFHSRYHETFPIRKYYF